MKTPAEALRTAYISALNGNLTDLNSNNVPVYDRVPTNAGDNYVYFSDYTENDSRTDKTEFGTEVTITLVVSCRYKMDNGGKLESDRIANQIIQLIRKRSVLSLSSPFYMITSTLDNSLTFEKKINTGVEISRTLRFRHIIGEN